MKYSIDIQNLPYTANHLEQRARAREGVRIQHWHETYNAALAATDSRTPTSAVQWATEVADLTHGPL